MSAVGNNNMRIDRLTPENRNQANSFLNLSKYNISNQSPRNMKPYGVLYKSLENSVQKSNNKQPL